MKILYSGLCIFLVDPGKDVTFEFLKDQILFEDVFG
jgi:hypothetical protein